MADALDAVKVVCPRARHGGAKVVRKGFQKDAKGRQWRRFECRLPSGGHHYFRVLADADDGAVVSSVVLAPPCPKHAQECRVIRFGVYGKTVKRQRYRCFPSDGSPAHAFALDLPRAHVNTAEVKCPSCAEFVSVHKGGEASSRRSKWSMRAVVEALVELSQGTSYSKASQNVWEKTEAAEAHAHTHEEPAEEQAAQTATVSESWSSERGRNAWHVAADIVEQYGPVLYAHAMTRVHEREQAQRVENDKLIAAGQPVTCPVTFVLDEVPVYLRQKGGKSRQAWNVHAVAEVLWRPGKTPMDVPQRESRLRLVRALPGSATTESWLLVLDELGVVPDVVVSDFGQAMGFAVADRFTSHGTLVIPSLYHFKQAMRLMLVDSPGYFEVKHGKPVALPDLAKHVKRITRDDLVTIGVQGWSDWWDEFELLAVTAHASTAPIVNRRAVYENPVAAAIPALTSQPYLPASNAGIEVKNRNLLKPLLRGRQQRYRNIARTNALFDLLVCQENRVFLDTDLVTRLIREDNLAHGGWSTPLRSFNDIQPPPMTTGEDEDDAKRVRRYSSLLDTGLVPALLEAR